MLISHLICFLMLTNRFSMARWFSGVNSGASEGENDVMSLEIGEGVRLLLADRNLLFFRICAINSVIF